jgi:histidine ammonia-lyase
MNEIFRYGLDHLTVPIALKLVNGELEGVLTEEVKLKIRKSFNNVQTMLQSEKLTYGVNTGFGSLATTKISKEETGKLQENLLKSHSVGVGPIIDQDIAKLMLILKIHVLSMGYSGISEQVIERILWHIQNDWIPMVYSQGSVGASGDLAPLAHLFIPLIGLGFLSNDGKTYHKSQEILDQNKMKPICLQAKEGLALINGTQFIAAHSVMVADKFFNCLEHADIIGALSLEGYLASLQPFKEELINLRPHIGAQQVAQKFRLYLKNSGFIKSHVDCGRVQDPYSIRCIPQVHGASRDAVSHFIEKLECELNSVTDNPVIFDENTAISGGNFHGQPLALPLDYVSLAASELGNISDRRTYLLLEGKWGLPAYLIKDSGLNSGFMIAQYCSAALASENKTNCFPASADSIPTSMGQEDHVSMGSISARKALNIVKNLENILAIEMLCAAQAIDFRRPLKSSNFVEAIHKFIRERIPHVVKDTILSDLIEKCAIIIQSRELLELTKIYGHNEG